MCKRISNMKVYISGKIGEEVISEATRQKFARAQRMLEVMDYEVFNPTDEKWQRTLRREYDNDQYMKSPFLMGQFPDFYAYALLRDLMVLSTKDAIYMLADWTESDGANVELDFARATGKQMFWESKEDALVFRNDEEHYNVWLPIEEGGEHE